MKARQIKWIAGAIAMVFLLAGTSWADGRRDRGPDHNGKQQYTQKHRPGHGGPGNYHQAQGHGHHKPQPYHNNHRPNYRPHKPQHYGNGHHHQHKPQYAHGHQRPDHRSGAATIRVNPNRVLLSALFANPLLLFDVDIHD